MGQLLDHRLTIIRPHLSGRQAGPVPSKQRPGKRAGMVLDPVPAGLGDWVETWAKPIARWIDANHPLDPVIGLLVRLAVQAKLVTLPIAGCSACSRRRRLFNWLVPDLRSWTAWRRAPLRLVLYLLGRRVGIL
jgi:hypothetical protein